LIALAYRRDARRQHAGLHRLKQELERDLSDSGRPGIRDKTETSAVDVPGWSKKLRWESSEAPAGRPNAGQVRREPKTTA